MSAPQPPVSAMELPLAKQLTLAKYFCYTEACKQIWRYILLEVLKKEEIAT